MGKGPCAFKKSDIMRAVGAARKAGLEIVHVKVSRDGGIDIVVGKPSDAGSGTTATEKNEWDAEYGAN